MASVRGRETFGVDAALRLAQTPMLSLHGGTNGLADPETANQLRAWQAQHGLRLTVLDNFPNHGHQDSLIGQDCTAIFEAITQFLNKH